jgi:hypothetical protein
MQSVGICIQVLNGFETNISLLLSFLLHAQSPIINRLFLNSGRLILLIELLELNSIQIALRRLRLRLVGLKPIITRLRFERGLDGAPEFLIF